MILIRNIKNGFQFFLMRISTSKINQILINLFIYNT